jgi:hypothetical protein
MQYTHCDTTEAFAAEARSRGLAEAVLAWREEYGPAATADGKADYRAVRQVTLLAYDQGTIVRCELVDADRRAVKAALESTGLRVEERCRNLAAPG